MKEKQKAIFFIILSCLFFAIMSATVKAIPEIPLAQKVFFRNFIGLIAVGIPMIIHNKTFKPHKPVHIFFRAAFGVSGVALHYASLQQLNLADAVILNKLSPFFVVILSAIFLSEDMTKNKILALFLAGIGAILVVRPGFHFSPIPAFLGLAGAFCAGSAYTLIRRISQYDPPYVIVFYFCLLSTLVTIPFMLLGQFIMPNPKQLMLLFLVGFAALAGQLTMTTAYKHAPAGELSIYSYINVIFSTGISIIIWNDWPSILSIIGTILIVSAALINFYNNKTPSKTDESV